MSREKILQAVKRNKPDLNPLPPPPEFPPLSEDLVAQFMVSVENAGGKVELLDREASWEAVVETHYPEAKRTLCRIPDSTLGNLDLDGIQELTDLHGLDLAILQARIGVAENAAVWLTEREMGQRVVPFIAEHLVVVLDRQQIVSNMHEAYRRIEIDETGFGLFIAGPSKTADIEQSLVIGAQGPRTWLVMVV